MNYAEKRRFVYIVEVREKNKKTKWGKSWHPTGLGWHSDKRSAVAEVADNNRQCMYLNTEYRVTKYRPVQ